MKKKLTILAIVVVVAALISFGEGIAQARPGLNVDDFALFTTETDDFVTCTASGPATLHITATNLETDGEDRINIVFADDDSVLIRVPTGESFSMTQVIGTSPGIDTEIKIDPLDQDGDPNAMVGWVSIRGLNVSCTVISL